LYAAAIGRLGVGNVVRENLGEKQRRSATNNAAVSADRSTLTLDRHPLKATRRDSIFVRILA
jgi:hypothetical protein